MELEQDHVSRLSHIADVMLPATTHMPSVTEAGALENVLSNVLDARPDLKKGLIAAIDFLPKSSFDLADLEKLLEEDLEAYTALTTIVAASYYQVQDVKNRIGYPGQVPKTYDPYAYIEWVQEGLLDTVVERGPIWKDPWKESK